MEHGDYRVRIVLSRLAVIGLDVELLPGEESSISSRRCPRSSFDDGNGCVGVEAHLGAIGSRNREGGIDP